KASVESGRLRHGGAIPNHWRDHSNRCQPTTRRKANARDCRDCPNYPLASRFGFFVHDGWLHSHPLGHCDCGDIGAYHPGSSALGLIEACSRRVPASSDPRLEPLTELLLIGTLIVASVRAVDCKSAL